MKFKISRPGRGIIEKSLPLRRFEIDWNGSTRSKFQTKVKQFLYPYWARHMCYEELRVAGTLMTLDLFNLTLRLAVECQGAQHTEFNKHFHGNHINNFLGQLKRDQKKEEFCNLNGITLVEIFPGEKLDEGLARKLKLI